MSSIKVLKQDRSELRQEIHSAIDSLAEKDLASLKPLIDHLVDLSDPLIIETDLTPDEKAILDAGAKEYEENPDSFISLTEYEKTLQNTKRTYT